MEYDGLKTRPDLSLEEIDVLLKNEKDVTIFKKLSYIKFQKLGFSKVEACNLATLPESSKYYLDELWNDNGYSSFKRSYCNGRRTKLTPGQIRVLQDKLDTKDAWVVGDVKKYILNEFNVQYAYSGVKDLLKRLDVEVISHSEVKRRKSFDCKTIISEFTGISDETRDELELISSYLDNEKQIYLYRRLIYLLLVKMGFTNVQVCELLKINSSTGSRWLKLWNKKGYEGIVRKNDPKFKFGPKH